MYFQLKENKKKTENKTIRFPVALIDQIEDVIQSQDITFSSFVLQACEYALNNMENKKKTSKKLSCLLQNSLKLVLIFQLVPTYT